MNLHAGINGFGRFGMHLLQYWAEHYSEAQFDIAYLNDDSLSLEQIREIIEADKYLTLRNILRFEDDALVVTIGGEKKRIEYTSTAIDDIPWLGKPDIFLECSGKHAEKKTWDTVLTGATENVIISATSWSAEQILIYGYNHESFDAKRHKVVSYGSCTVNAYVPLAQWVQDAWGVVDSDVNVVHNVPVHKLGEFDSLERRACTLEQVAPHVLDFVTSENFTVTYTLVPYGGVSMIDFRFRLGQPAHEKTVRQAIAKAVAEGSLKNLYTIAQQDNGPEAHKFTPHSAVLLEPSIRLKGDNLYIGAYFDNENSVNRYFDIANHITLTTQDEKQS